MNCIFCGVDAGKGSLEHIVAHSLGNEHYVLSNGEICSSCNTIFSKFERDALLDMESIKYNRISEILAAKGLSNIWLGEKLDVHVQSVSNWCVQKNQPSWKHLYSIADLLEIDVRELLVPNDKSPRKDFKFSFLTRHSR